MLGAASGFSNIDCISTPETANAAPASTDATTLGSLTAYIILLFVEPSLSINALKKSETGILVAPRHTPSKIDIIKATMQIVINISSFLFFSVEIVCEYFIAFTPSRIGFVMEKCLIQYYISSVLDR